jgi:hypothetical protein
MVVFYSFSRCPKVDSYRLEKRDSKADFAASVADFLGSVAAGNGVPPRTC